MVAEPATQAEATSVLLTDRSVPPMAEYGLDGDEDPFEAQRANAEDPMWRLFGEYGRPNWPQFAVGVLASVTARLLDLVPPIMLGVAIDAVFRDETAFSLWLVPDAWLPADAAGQFWLTIGVIAGAFALGAAFHWLRNWGFNAFAQRIQHAVRTDTYDTMQRLNMDFFADKQTGELMSVLSNDVNRLERFLNDGLNSVFRLSVRNRSRRLTSFERTLISSPVCLSAKNSMFSRCIVS